MSKYNTFESEKTLLPETTARINSDAKEYSIEGRPYDNPTDESAAQAGYYDGAIHEAANSEKAIELLKQVHFWRKQVLPESLLTEISMLIFPES